MSKKLTWENIEVTVGELEIWVNNPKYITEANAARLVESHKEFNQPETLQIGPKQKNGKYPVYNGNQRTAVWLKAFGPNFKVQARISSRPLTEHELQKLTILQTFGTTGAPDYDVLANTMEVEDLRDWGVPLWRLDILEQEEVDINDFFETVDDHDIEETVTFSFSTTKHDADRIELYLTEKNIDLYKAVMNILN